MTHPEVLIIGAGPTGLMAACQLAIRGISFRIIDKSDDHTTQSRALVIHARSLEIFQQMGLAEEALQHGKKAKALNLIINGKRKLHFGLSDIGTNLTDFPFLLILEQSKTEMILNNFLLRLGHQVERRTELISFSQSNSIVEAVIRKPDGKLETIQSEWMLGADGAHSIVRNQLKIPFLGKIYQQSLFVLDCKVNLHLPKDELYVTFSDKTFALFVPMTNGRCRIIGLIPKELQSKDEITFEDIHKNLAQQTHLNIILQKPEWIAKYNTHHRVVSDFRKERCFLVGDAAHIHSPVGAQGMNTGLQDAYNICWKLALVIQKRAKENLLDSYHQERLGIAKKLVKTTDKVFHLFTSENPYLKTYRLRVIPFILKLFLPVARNIKFIKKYAFINISEIALNYRKSQLSQKDTPFVFFNNNSLKPGDRVPYSSQRIDFTQGNSFHLLLFSHQKLSKTIYDDFKSICDEYPGLISLQEVLFTQNTRKVFFQFGINEAGFYLIRPDSYVAYKSLTLNTENLKNYLSKLFIAKR